MALILIYSPNVVSEFSVFKKIFNIFLEVKVDIFARMIRCQVSEYMITFKIWTGNS